MSRTSRTRIGSSCWQPATSSANTSIAALLFKRLGIVFKLFLFPIDSFDIAQAGIFVEDDAFVIQSIGNLLEESGQRLRRDSRAAVFMIELQHAAAKLWIIGREIDDVIVSAEI